MPRNITNETSAVTPSEVEEILVETLEEELPGLLSVDNVSVAKSGLAGTLSVKQNAVLDIAGLSRSTVGDVNMTATIGDLNAFSSGHMSFRTTTANRVISFIDNGYVRMSIGNTDGSVRTTLIEPHAGVDTMSINGVDITTVGNPSRISTLTATNLIGEPAGILKYYIDEAVVSVSAKESVRVATTANLSVTYNSTTLTLTATANGAISIDTMVLAVNDRVLVKNQTNKKHNGIFVVTVTGTGGSPFVLTRAADANGSPSNTVQGGNTVLVTGGAVSIGKLYIIVGLGVKQVANVVEAYNDEVSWVSYAPPNIFNQSLNTTDTVTFANIVTPGLVDGVDISARDAILTTTTTTANQALPRSGGTMTGNINMTNNDIFLSPGGTIDGVDISSRDAVLTTTTNTADAALPKAGGTMTGNIVMGANNITLTTGLVDGVDVSARDAILTTTTTTANAALPTTGGTMTGNIVMGANSITLAGGGLVDGVDVSARDAILTTTTTTANAALARAGGTMTGALAMGANTITTTGNIGSGTFRAANGSASAPSHSFTGETNTGLYLSVATQLAIVTSGVTRMSIDGANVAVVPNLIPSLDNTVTCGGPSNRWTAVYAVNGAIQTSDSRMKNTITALPSTLGLSFVNALNPVSFKWNDTINEGMAPIVHTRTHLGLIAQEVKTAIEAAGHTLQTTDIIDNDYLLDNTQADRYAIRMHALIAPLIKAVQELSARVAVLEGV